MSLGVKLSEAARCKAVALGFEGKAGELSLRRRRTQRRGRGNLIGRIGSEAFGRGGHRETNPFGFEGKLGLERNGGVGRTPSPPRFNRRPCTCRATPTGKDDEANQLIEDILVDIKRTDFGAKVQSEKRKRIDDNILRLIELSEKQSPLDDEGIFSVYSVAYSSPGPDQKGAPAGGRFRGPIGKLLFRTTGLYQAILPPDLAKNLVTFLLFGLLPGSIALEGTFKKLDKKTVKVLFQRPKFTLLGQTFSFGPASAVELQTPAFYADKIRIGKGSRGSLFVFVPDEKSQEQSVMDEFQRVPKKRSWVFIAAALAFTLAFFYAIQRLLGPKAVIAGSLVALGVASVLNRGGIVDDPKCPPLED